MSLRTRLLAATLTVTVLLVTVMAAIVIRQRAVLTRQIDDQLLTVASAIDRTEGVGMRTLLTERPALGTLTSDFFFAVVLPNGSLQPIVAPVSHPEFAPVTDDLVERATPTGPDDPGSPIPFTVDSVAGPGQARTIAIQVDDGANRWVVVVARSTDRIDEAQRQLAMTAGLALVTVSILLGLVLWWVDRLGLRPIGRLTEAAEAVAAGRSERRVEHPPVTTETGRLGAAFNTMLDARQEAERRQRRFVADASHELRTPLTTLRGYTALHASGGLTTPEAVDDALRRIQAEADRMAGLVQDLLTLAALDEVGRWDPGRRLDLAGVDLTRLLIDIGADAAAVQPDRTVDTEAVDPGLQIEADLDLLTQALTAVTSNTLRHTPPSAGLSLGAGVAAGDDGRPVIRVTVSDRGPGIDPDRLPRLFDRFYRVDTGRTTASGGRGLGLSIARSVVEAHGGTIAAASAPGAGTTITIDMPGTDAPVRAGAANRRR